MKFKPIYLLYVILLIPFLYRLWGNKNPESLEWEKLEVQSLDGQFVDLSEYKGKKVVMNFWATWCGPCLAEMPSMEEARRQLGEDYAFVLISDEPLEKIRGFKASKPDYGFEFLQLRQSINSQGIRSIPQTYIINSYGEIVDDISGMTDWARAARIESLRAVE